MIRLCRSLVVACVVALTCFAFTDVALAGTTPYRVQTSSATDSAFTVSWVTTTAETGHVEIGTSAGSLTTTVHDSRGATTSSTFHHVRVTGLTASTTYHWRIVSGGTGYGDPAASGSPYQQTTGPSLVLLGSSFVAGRVYLTDGTTPAAGVLVHVTLKDSDGSGSQGVSQTLTVLSDVNGDWLLARDSFRTTGLGGGFGVSSSGDDIVVVADAGVTGRVATTVDTSWSGSSPTTISQSLLAPGVPTVTDVSPAVGTNTVARDVTITGTDLLFATAAALSDASATALTGFAVETDTRISATVPSGVAAGTYDVRVTAPAGTNATSTVTFTAVVAPQVTASTLPVATEGLPYSAAAGVTGGAAPYTWTLTGGALPAGLTLSSDGVVSGTPTTAGVASLALQVTDDSGVSAAGTLSLTVADPISTPAGVVPEATVGRPFGPHGLSTTGGALPVTWTITGLPGGLTATPNGRSVSLGGTPGTAGSHAVSFRVVDANGSTATANRTIVVNAPVTAPVGALPAWTVGVAYGSRQITVTGGTSPITWDVTGLPTGLTSSASGRTLTISGTPGAAGDFDVTATATDANGATAATTFAVSFSAPVASPVGTLPSWTQGVAYTPRDLSTTGGTGAVTWDVTGLPPGLTWSASDRTLTVSGTPSLAGSYTLTATATDSVGSAATAGRTIVVAAPLVAPAGALPDWTQGRDYGVQTLATTGGTAPFTWDVSGLPGGLTWSASDRHVDVTGAATQTGTFTVAVTVTDAVGASASRQLGLTMNPPVTAPSGALIAWTVGQPYAPRTLTTTGGTDAVVWSAIGLPTGLDLAANGRSATVSGTPTVAGSFDVTVQVSDAAGSMAQSVHTVVVNPPLTSPVGTLPDWTRGHAYTTATLTTTGGTDAIAWLATGLPPGLTATGTGRALDVTGTPAATGSFSVDVSVTDAAGSTASRTVVLVINEPLTPPVSALVDWTVGRPYGARTATTTGGTEPITWTVGGLPPGLAATPDVREVAIAGTPETAGAYPVSLTATDAVGSTATLVVPVRISAAVTSPVGTLPEWTVGQDYGQRAFTTTGGTAPLTWSVTGLPGGLVSAPSGGGVTVVGTPSQAGAHVVAVQVTDAAGSTASRVIALTINGPLVAPAGALPDWTQGRDYGQHVLSTGGGTLPLAWQVTGLPGGLTMSIAGRDLTVGGTPSAAGSYDVTIRVTDAAGATVLRLLTVDVARPVAAPSGALVAWTLGRAYPRSIVTTSGGTAPLVWQVTGLPGGLGWSADDRRVAVDGTPAEVGSFDVEVQVTDAAGSVAATTWSLVVNAPPTAPTGLLPDWTEGVAYGDHVVSTTAGTPPYTWASTGLPTGLLVAPDGAACTISGTPSVPGTFAVAVTVTDAAGATSTATWPVTVNGALGDPTGTLPEWTRGQEYGPQRFDVAGGTPPLTWDVAGLPVGLSALPLGRVCEIGGAPGASGVMTVNFRVTDAAGDTVIVSRSLVLNEPVGIAQQGSLAERTIGVASEHLLTTLAGTAPYTWELLAGGVPGMGLDGDSGVFAGTPSMAGPFSITVRVRDVAGSTASATLGLNVNERVRFLDAALPFASAGDEYAHELVFDLGTPPYAFALEGDALPEWLAIDGLTGTLGGVPSGPGRHDVTVRIVDGAGAAVTRDFTLEVAQVVDLLSGAEPTFEAGPDVERAIFAFDGVRDSSLIFKIGRLDRQRFEGDARLTDALGRDMPLPRPFDVRRKGRSVAAKARSLPVSRRQFLVIERLGAEPYTGALGVKAAFRTRYAGTVELGGDPVFEFSAPLGTQVALKLAGKGRRAPRNLRLVRLSTAQTQDALLLDQVGSKLSFPPLTTWGDFEGEVADEVAAEGSVKYAVKLKIPKPVRAKGKR